MDAIGDYSTHVRDQVVGKVKDLDISRRFHCMRLASFPKWPPGAPLSAVILARDGFYYEGNGDEVVCFSCHGKIRNWKKGDEPKRIHDARFPNCKGLRTENIPFGPSMPVEEPTVGNIPMSKSDLSAQLNGLKGPNDSGFGDTFSSRGSISLLPNPRERLPLSHVSESSGPESNTPSITDIAPIQQTSNPTLLKHEQNRLNSFVGWPESVPATPAELAAAGFYFLGDRDKVKCVFCALILRNWEAGDVPMTEHKRFSPLCDFVLGRDTGNVPIVPNSDEPPIEPPILGHDLGITLASSAKHPEYAVTEHRLRTYGQWPDGAGQQPRVLVAAGFYFTGFADNVKCFYCDGGLRNWEDDDEPLVEHARWFPRCTYLIRLKGQTFVDEVQARFGYPRSQPPQQRDSAPLSLSSQVPDDVYRNLGVTLTGDSPEARAHTHAVDPREIKARMDTPRVRTVLGLGIPRSIVKQAIENQLRTNGDDFPSAERLMEAAMTIQQEQNEQNEQNEQTARSIPPPAEHSSIPPQHGNARLSTPPPTSSPTLTTRREVQRNTGASNSMTGNSGDSTSLKTSMTGSSDTGSNDEAGIETQSLVEENRQLRDAKTCKVCMDNDVNVVFLPCGHLVCCNTCAPALRNCPICRAGIKGTVLTFLA